MHICGQSRHTHAHQIWCTRTHGRNKWWVSRYDSGVPFQCRRKTMTGMCRCSPSLNINHLYNGAPFFGPANFMLHSNDGFYYIFALQAFRALNYKDKSTFCLLSYNSNHVLFTLKMCMLNILWYSYDVCFSLSWRIFLSIWFETIGFHYSSDDSHQLKFENIKHSLHHSLNVLFLLASSFFKEILVVIFPHEYNLQTQRELLCNRTFFLLF